MGSFHKSAIMGLCVVYGLSAFKTNPWSLLMTVFGGSFSTNTTGRGGYIGGYGGGYGGSGHK